MIYLTGNNAYSVVHDHKNGWNPEAFRERFSEVLERYDYIVGDWGYSQLRLRGFFRDPQPKAPKESVISHLYEYIHEYCNFGCAYFVIEKLDPAAVPEGAGVRLEELPTGTPAAEQTDGDGEDGQEGEPAAQAPAAAISLPTGGLLMRWPLKERPGGRVPGTSPSAVARAVSEGAERRAAAAQTAAASSRDEMYGRGSPFDGARQDRGGDSRDRKPGGGGYRGGSSSGGYERRTQGGGYNKQEQRQHPRDGGDRATTSGADGGGGYRGGGHKSGGAPDGGNRSGGAPGKWQNKNRRRGPQGGGQPGGPLPGGGNSQSRYSSGAGQQQSQPSGKPRYDGGQRPEHGQRGDRTDHGQRPEHGQRSERPSGGASRSSGAPRADGGGRPDRGAPTGE
ncbi:YutD-like domain-containing protein [Cohnella sp. GCM10020058]|uniref:YutD-like domain-containing protein n=1 Tax=Cohnella sp. GCM10020058 TaxID=3317330 RepID=UPI0036311769